MNDRKTMSIAGIRSDALPNVEPATKASDAERIAWLLNEVEYLRGENLALRAQLLRAEGQLRSAVPSQPSTDMSAALHRAVAPPAAESAPPTNMATVMTVDQSVQRAGFIPPPMQAGAALPMSQGIDFGAIAKLTPDKLDGLPYGLITLDAKGRIIHYNDTEARLVGLPKDRVIGKNFFADVAPCTRLREFEGRFLELAADPVNLRVATFDFVFRFAKGEQFVTVVITPARARGQFHMALVRR
jgi:photoactive yellow protein